MLSRHSDPRTEDVISYDLVRTGADGEARRGLGHLRGGADPGRRAGERDRRPRGAARPAVRRSGTGRRAPPRLPPIGPGPGRPPRAGHGRALRGPHAWPVARFPRRDGGHRPRGTDPASPGSTADHLARGSRSRSAGGRPVCPALDPRAGRQRGQRPGPGPCSRPRRRHPPAGSVALRRTDCGWIV